MGNHVWRVIQKLVKGIHEESGETLDYLSCIFICLLFLLSILNLNSSFFNALFLFGVFCAVFGLFFGI